MLSLGNYWCDQFFYQSSKKLTEILIAQNFVLRNIWQRLKLAKILRMVNAHTLEDLTRLSFVMKYIMILVLRNENSTINSAR